MKGQQAVQSSQSRTWPYFVINSGITSPKIGVSKGVSFMKYRNQVVMELKNLSLIHSDLRF